MRAFLQKAAEQVGAVKVVDHGKGIRLAVDERAYLGRQLRVLAQEPEPKCISCPIHDPLYMVIGSRVVYALDLVGASLRPAHKDSCQEWVGPPFGGVEGGDQHVVACGARCEVPAGLELVWFHKGYANNYMSR